MHQLTEIDIHWTGRKPLSRLFYRIGEQREVRVREDFNFLFFIFTEGLATKGRLIRELKCRFLLCPLEPVQVRCWYRFLVVQLLRLESHLLIAIIVVTLIKTNV